MAYRLHSPAKYIYFAVVWIKLIDVDTLNSNLKSAGLHHV